ncbi:MAG TPA: hypothetical protein VIE66_03690 [Methylocella sp.]
MCDYSLHLVASRSAQVGDKLVTTTFANSLTRGLSAVGEPKVAVCLLAGTEVAFGADVKYDRAFSLLPNRALKERVARFRQIRKDRPDVHHDALEFPSGRIVLITRLRDGQQLTVLQLPVLLPAAIKADELKRSTFVA